MTVNFEFVSIFIHIFVYRCMSIIGNETEKHDHIRWKMEFKESIEESHRYRSHEIRQRIAGCVKFK